MKPGTPPVPAPKPRLLSARFVASAPDAKLLPPPIGIEIAFAGRSNVGKSTLLNALMERKGLARTSSTPGRTRDIVFFEIVAADGATLTLVDLPGYGYAKRSKAERASWGALAEDYLLGRPSLVAVVLLVDIRRGVEEDDQDFLELMASPPRVSRREVGTLLVATKLDKLVSAARKPALSKLTDQVARRVAGFAESDRATHEHLWREVRRIAAIPLGGPPEPESTVTREDAQDASSGPDSP
jgi:GTP-binding protein